MFWISKDRELNSTKILISTYLEILPRPRPSTWRHPWSGQGLQNWVLLKQKKLVQFLWKFIVVIVSRVWKFIILHKLNKMDKPQIFVYQEEQLDFSCSSCCWLPSSSKFSLVGTNARNEGVLRIYQVERNKLACQKHVEVPKNSSRCCTSDFSDDAQRKIAIGCLNGHLEVYFC